MKTLLLRAALALCPSEFRSHYADEIRTDVRVGPEDQSFTEHALTCIDVAFTGLRMRLEELMRNLAFAVRMLLRAPLFASISILTIALAIGANVAVVSVLNAVLLQPLPYQDANRLVFVTQGGQFVRDLSYPDALAIARENIVFSRFGSSIPSTATVSGVGPPFQIRINSVSDSYFATLGTRPELGRLLSEQDHATRRLVLSDEFWRKYFNGSAQALGRHIQIDSIDYEIVGVAPRGFQSPTKGGPLPFDLWRTIDPRADYASPGSTNFYGIGVLRPGVSIAAAQADMTRILSQQARRDPGTHQNFHGGFVLPMLAQMVGSIATLLWLLYAAVCAVLLIACVNVANLSLVRAVARSRELVVRAALGATRYRIAVALYTETFVLSLAGAALGILIGILALHAFTDIGQTTLPRWNDVHVDWRVLGYVGGTVIAFTVFSGMLPAFGQRRQLADRMRSGGRSETGGTSTRTNGAFVIAEIALAIAIVACAGLVLRSFVALTHVPIGFDSRNLYLARFALPDAKCAQLRPCADLIRRLSASVDAIPGVESSSVAFAAPFGQAYNTTYLVIPHQTKPLFKVTYDVISPAFFETFRAPMLRGRAFTDGDRAGTMPVAIVNATLARALSGGSLDVIGKHIVPQASFSGPPPILTIVGVAADMRTSYSTPPERVVYAPYLQLPGVEQFVIRTKGPIPGLGAALDSALASVDPTLARPTLVSYSDLLAQNALQSKAATMLFGALALVALFLAMCGVFAVAIYSVEGRTREFGIRTALGARTSTLLNDVLARAALQGFVGIAIGLVVAAAGTRYLSSQLFETSPLDPLTFAAVTFLIVACTLSASLIPAVRAARVDPVVALRYE